MPDNGRVELRWKTIGLGSLLVNLAAIGALAVVASVKRADVLSTVALALAVLSFIGQIIIFTFQAVQSADHLKQAEAIKDETVALLSEARTRIEGTQQMVSRQYDQFQNLLRTRDDLDIDKRGSATGESDDAKDDSARSGSDQYQDRAEPGHLRGAGGDPAIPTEGRRSILLRLQENLEGRMSSKILPKPPALLNYWTWPPRDEAELSLAALTEILDGNKYGPGVAMSLMFDFGGDILSVGVDEISGALEYSPTNDRPLMELGWVKEGPAELTAEGGSHKRMVVMTEKGREVVRILSAPWPPPAEYPPELVDQIWKLRGRYERFTA